MITPRTTLGELEIRLAAFGLRAEFAPLKSDGYYEVALVDPDGIYGIARGASIAESIAAAFASYVAKVGKMFVRDRRVTERA